MLWNLLEMEEVLKWWEPARFCVEAERWQRWIVPWCEAGAQPCVVSAGGRVLPPSRQRSCAAGGRMEVSERNKWNLNIHTLLGQVSLLSKVPPTQVICWREMSLEYLSPLQILPVMRVKDQTLFSEPISSVPSTAHTVAAQTPFQRPLIYLSMIWARFGPFS